MRPREAARVGVIIAQRRLHVRGAPRRTVLVTLARPRRTKGSEEWECPFRIKGAGIHRLEYGFGIDAFQALTMALEGIRYFLDRSPEPLVWSAFDDHSGFQRVIPFVAQRGGMRRIERIVDQEVRRWAEKLERRHRTRRPAPAARRSAKRQI